MVNKVDKCQEKNQTLVADLKVKSERRQNSHSTMKVWDSGTKRGWRTLYVNTTQLFLHVSVSDTSEEILRSHWLRFCPE